MWIVLALTAHAGGFYHPAEVAPASKAYARAAKQAGSVFSTRQQAVERLATALVRYEEALDLLGPDAPAAERERIGALRKEFNRERAVLEAFATAMMEDFDAEFTGAMQRAAAQVGGTQECPSMVPDGKQVPGLRPRMKKNPDCKGDDLNQAVAKAMDADAVLTKALDEILALEWPTLELTAEPQAVIGGGPRYVDVGAFFRAGARDVLRTIVRDDETARLDFQADIEEGATTEDLEKHLEAARTLTAQTAARRADLARPALSAADAILAKWAKKGDPHTGWCANPPALGGCEGDAITDERLAELLASKKVYAALP